MTATRVRNLQDQSGASFPRPFLYCVKCGGEYSAHRGDYFLLDPDHVFKCCRRLMALVTMRVVLTEAR